MHARSPSLDENGTVRGGNGVRLSSGKEVQIDGVQIGVQRKYSPLLADIVYRVECFVVVSSILD